MKEISIAINTINPHIRLIMSGLTFLAYYIIGYFITLLVLYADDLRIIFFTKDQDIIVDIILVFCVFIFLIEGVISSYALPDYLWSFFFTTLWNYCLQHRSESTDRSPLGRSASGSSDISNNGVG